MAESTAGSSGGGSGSGGGGGSGSGGSGSGGSGDSGSGAGDSGSSGGAGGAAAANTAATTSGGAFQGAAANTAATTSGGAFQGAAANTTATTSGGPFRGSGANTTGGGFTGRGSTQSRTEVPNLYARIFEPLIDFQFSVTIGPAVGIPITYATEVTGLDFERDYIEHKYVGKDFQAFTQMVPGRIKYQPVTIKQLLSVDPTMWEWFLAHEGPTGNPGNFSPLSYDKARYPVTIISYTRDFVPAITWILNNAWPSKVAGPRMQSSGREFSVEEVVLVYDSMTRISNLAAG